MSSMPEFPGSEQEPSPEQMMALLAQLQAAGHNLDEISPDLTELMRKVKREKGQPTEDVPMEEITPEPSFVIKTADTVDGTKIFINVCASDKVPAPGNWSTGQVPEEVQKALENRDNGADAESLRFPLSCGQPKADVDRKGERCLTCDCIINADVLKQAAVFRPLKAFLIELAIGWVGHKTSKTLDPKFKLPKMKYKGEEIEKQNIRVERKPLVCEVMDIEEDPTFPLVTKRPKQPLVPPAAAAPAPSTQTSEPSSSRTPAVGMTASTTPGSGSAIGDRKQHVSTSHGPQMLRHTVEYINRPADEILVTVQLPGGQRQGVASSSGSGGVAVEVCGRTLHVSAPGCLPLGVPLLFAVWVGGSSVQQAGDSLAVRLKVLPLRDYVVAMRSEKPLAFGQIGLGSAGLLELE